MFNKKSTWIIFVLIGVFCTIGAYKIFPKAFPILNISLDMSRSDALEKASNLTNEFDLGPEGAFQVATFGVDQKAQNYIELDAGGASEFIEIVVDKHYYEAYTWDVRQYKPGEVNEVWITFTSKGDVYGFHEMLSEDVFIESLNEKKAMRLAESSAKNHWNVDME